MGSIPITRSLGENASERDNRDKCPENRLLSCTSKEGLGSHCLPLTWEELRRNLVTGEPVQIGRAFLFRALERISSDFVLVELQVGFDAEIAQIKPLRLVAKDTVAAVATPAPAPFTLEAERPPQGESSAIISACGLYRYQLWRRWRAGQHVVFIGLNPSTADATTNDPTIRKCMGYARLWGYGAICMVNLFAFRATQPKAMLRAEDPIGPENTDHLLEVTKSAALVICAWGRDGVNRGQDQAVLSLLRRAGITPHCLQVNQDGTPAHPLYLHGGVKPQPLVIAS